MTLSGFFIVSQWFFMLYFLAMQAGYMMLNILSIIAIRKYMQEHSVNNLPRVTTGLEMPISLLVPAYNEEVTIIDSVLSLLQLNYPEFEIIVINDGSKDKTLDILKEQLELKIFPESYYSRLPTQEIRQIYTSKKYRNIKVIDKNNGGKADALNAGINAARSPLFCAVDADSILQSNSLDRIVQPFLEDPRTVAAGGSVRIANGCHINKGFVTKADLPKNLLALFQVSEYLRAFLFGRLGWSPMNALLIVSGAFGLFHKETVVSVGGYKSNTIGEDMELIVRMHRLLRKRNKPYRITFVPDPICWTEAPEDLKTLRNQRIRWQRGLSESLLGNLGLLFDRRSGLVGWVAMPYMLFFEWLGPIIELFGLFIVALGLAFGYVSPEVSLIFFTIAIGFGVLLSTVAVLLEEMSFHIYTRPTYIFTLFFCALIENFGYRQLNSWWRMKAMFQVFTRKKSSWGNMQRKGAGVNKVNRPN